MTNETKDSEKTSEKLTPVQKAAITKAKNAAKKLVVREVKNRSAAIRVMLDMNIPFDSKIDDETLIGIAEQVPLEKYYKIEIQPQDEFATKQAFCKINGKSFRLERGVEVVVPARVVEAFKNAVTNTVDMVDKPDGSKKILIRERRNEMISILGEVPAP